MADTARLRRLRSHGESARSEESVLRSRERRWLAAHRHSYPGLWLALDGDALIASGNSLMEVLREAKQKGSTNPLVAWSEEIEEAPFGGW